MKVKCTKLCQAEDISALAKCLAWHCVNRCVPKSLAHTEREDIVNYIVSVISPVVEILTIKEFSCIAQRIAYRECKALGWRKEKKEKRSVWTRDKLYA